jgi:hypothetical protein
LVHALFSIDSPSLNFIDWSISLANVISIGGSYFPIGSTGASGSGVGDALSLAGAEEAGAVAVPDALEFPFLSEHAVTSSVSVNKHAIMIELNLPILIYSSPCNDVICLRFYYGFTAYIAQLDDLYIY